MGSQQLSITDYRTNNRHRTLPNGYHGFGYNSRNPSYASDIVSEADTTFSNKVRRTFAWNCYEILLRPQNNFVENLLQIR